MKGFLVYPVSKSGKILKGFCPTLCDTSDEACKIMLQMCSNLMKFGVKFHNIKIEKCN